ncbi:MAG: S8 family peptidase, partial [Bacteroidota bacterium]|nr:S8 family peptidase [Bacteroidota bacterium]
MTKDYLAKTNTSKRKKLKNFKKLLSLLVLTPAICILSSCEKIEEEQVRPVASSETSVNATQITGTIGINVLLKSPITDAILSDLGSYGTVLDIIPTLNALSMRIDSGKLSAIRKLTYVSVASPDATRKGAPIDAVAVTDFSNGLSTWNLDAVNVTEINKGRVIAQDGTGVYIGVLDTGLLDSWRQYFPEQRIATQYSKSFSGGGGENGNVSEQPNKWEQDQNSHGTHVTSTILGFNLNGSSVNGVAPKATIIPV